jgi:uncharacterized protein Usg
MLVTDNELFYELKDIPEIAKVYVWYRTDHMKFPHRNNIARPDGSVFDTPVVKERSKAV